MAKKIKSPDEMTELYLRGIIQGKEVKLSRTSKEKGKSHGELAKERYDRDRLPIQTAIKKIPKTEIEIIEE
jgi:hypothetical protein